MAIGTNAFTTYSATVNREDLSDILHNISPVEDFCVKNFKTGKATSKSHDWAVDALAAPAANAHLDAEICEPTATVAVTRLYNYTQNIQKSVSISDSQEAEKSAGNANKLSVEKAKKMKELANDFEYALVINSAAVVGSTGTARQMKGVLGWITTNVVTATSATSGSGVNETDFNSLLALIWANGGMTNNANAICGSVQKRAISRFTGNNTRFITMENKTIDSAVDVYKSDHGNVSIHLHHIMNSAAPGSVVVFGDLNLWRKCYKRTPKWTDLAKTGTFTAAYIEMEVTLEAGNEKGSGKLTGYTA